MSQIPLIRRAVLVPAVACLAAEGAPVHRYLERAKLLVPSPDNLETLIPFYQFCDFLSSVARAEGMSDLGFRVAGHLGIESMGVYGRLIAQSLTLHDSIQTSIELISSYNSGQRIWLEYFGDQVRYRQKCVGNLPQDRITEVVHLGLANALGNARCLRGVDWRPSRIEVASDPVDLSLYFPGLSDLPVSFNHNQTSIWADRRELSTPLPAFDVVARPCAHGRDRAAYVKSGPASGFCGQLEQAIESVLGRPDLNLSFTAAIIGMSARTLQRRLAEHALPFSRLLQRVRFLNAQRLLSDARMRVGEIATRLGYTDAANFTRAFKRWTGIVPSEFRQLHYDGGRA
jgi:AraC-like DNA-binding protein